MRPRRGNVGIEASRQALNLVTMVASSLERGWSYTTVARQLDVWVQGLCNERLELMAQTVLGFDGFEGLRGEYAYAGASQIAIQAAIGRGVSNIIADTVSYELRKHFAAVARSLKTGDATKPSLKPTLAKNTSMSEQAAAEIAAMSNGDPPVR